jgi:hypothetical protein
MWVEWLIWASVVAVAVGRVLFEESFDQGWEGRWNGSQWRTGQQGQFVRARGRWHGGSEAAYGLQTSTDMKFYELSTKLPIPRNLSAGLFVVQFSVKFEQSIACGGGYIKLLEPTYKPETFGGETPALIIFGPDICGSNNRIHVILENVGRGEVWKKAPEAPNDRLTHIYTLALYNTSQYAVYVDQQLIENGNISDDWDLNYDPTVRQFVIGGIGIDVWQVKAGTLFDNLLIADSLEDAIQYAKMFMDKQAAGERLQKERAEEEDKRQEELQQQKLRAERERDPTREPLDEDL